jgi:hypothetical protein
MREVDAPGFGKLVELNDWLAGICSDESADGVRLDSRWYVFQARQGDFTQPEKDECGSLLWATDFVTPGQVDQDPVHARENNVLYSLELADHRQRDPKCTPAPAEIVLVEEIVAIDAIDAPEDPRRMKSTFFKSSINGP